VVKFWQSHKVGAKQLEVFGGGDGYQFVARHDFLFGDIPET
jgi:hypothetical protein